MPWWVGWLTAAMIIWATLTVSGVYFYAVRTNNHIRDRRNHP